MSSRHRLACLSNSLLLALVLLALAGCSPRPFTFAVNPSFPPFEDRQGGKLVGFDIDLARALASQMWRPVAIRTLNWDTLFEALRNGECDAVISAVIINPERQALYGFTEPYSDIGPVIVVPSGSHYLSNSDLKGRPVGVLAGSLADESVAFLRDGKAAQTFPDLRSAFGALATGGLYAVVADLPAAIRAVGDPAWQSAGFRVVGQPLASKPLGIVLRKDDQKDLDALNSALTALESDGTLQKLTDHWLRPSP